MPLRGRRRERGKKGKRGRGEEGKRERGEESGGRGGCAGRFKRGLCLVGVFPADFLPISLFPSFPSCPQIIARTLRPSRRTNTTYGVSPLPLQRRAMASGSQARPRVLTVTSPASSDRSRAVTFSGRKGSSSSSGKAVSQAASSASTGTAPAVRMPRPGASSGRPRVASSSARSSAGSGTSRNLAGGAVSRSADGSPARCSTPPGWTSVAERGALPARRPVQRRACTSVLLPPRDSLTKPSSVGPGGARASGSPRTTPGESFTQPPSAAASTPATTAGPGSIASSPRRRRPSARRAGSRWTSRSRIATGARSSMRTAAAGRPAFREAIQARSGSASTPTAGTPASARAMRSPPTPQPRSSAGPPSAAKRAAFAAATASELACSTPSGSASSVSARSPNLGTAARRALARSSAAATVAESRPRRSRATAATSAGFVSAASRSSSSSPAAADQALQAFGGGRHVLSLWQSLPDRTLGDPGGQNPWVRTMIGR